jgi:eukaryotic-like serine/threonine-protein kinase
MAPTTEILGGRYCLGRLLGQGAMSEVFEAVDERTGVAVAVKIVRSGDPDLARRMAQEARALELVEHPGLVRLLDTGSTDSKAYLVMELIDGSTLAAVLREGSLSPERTAAIGATLAEALASVHDQAIVHRDVKPSNILMTADGEVRLGDFGIARLLDASTLTVAGTTLGTAAYMAPEQLEDHQVGPGADIWSLGMVLLECLTGRRTYEGSPSEVVARRLAGPVPLPADLPVPWKLLLSGMLDHRPDQRLGGDEVAALLRTKPFRAPWARSRSPVTDRMAPTVPNDLTALAPGAGATAVLGSGIGTNDTRTSPPSVSGARRKRRWRLAVLGAVVVAALCVGLILGLGSSPKTPRTPSAIDANSSKTRPPATTTTSTTTTTTLPSGPTALAALVKDVASGESAGSVDPASGQSISNRAGQAIADETAGNANQAANDLQQAAMTIAIGVQSSKITEAEGATLQSDLSALSTAIGLGAAGAPPTTQPAVPGPGTGPGHGHGHGHGHGGDGNG